MAFLRTGTSVPGRSRPFDRQTVGLLGRRHITQILPLHERGKEGHRIDEREAGVAENSESRTEYGDPSRTRSGSSRSGPT